MEAEVREIEVQVGEEALKHPKKTGVRNLLIASGMVVAIAFGIYERLSAGQEVAVSPPLTVQTLKLKPVQSYQVTRFYTGEVVATRRSELGFERGGKVTEIIFNRGQTVEKGAVIARLDTQNLQAQLAQLAAQRSRAVAELRELQNGPRPETIAVARSQVADLENRLRLENIRRDRRSSLYAEGAISREQLDEVAFNRDALADRLAAAQSELEALQNGTRSEQIAAQAATVAQIAASIRDVEINIEKSILRAPFRGVVGERNLDEGTVVQAGQAIVRLVENVTPEVEIGVPPQVVQSLKVGSRQQVLVSDSEALRSERIYTAQVLAHKPEINPQTRTRTVVLQLVSTGQTMPVSGEIARLQVEQMVSTQGFWLPVSALIKGEQGLWSCFVVASEGETYVIERRDVEVLYTEGDRVLVRGTITAGEEVVNSGTNRLVSGQIVKSVNSEQ
ncbi:MULTISPECIES: efflux RND transporter periplasmic adaptor subunit [Cyanophyceae]|uniref:efflux RND transporter periplasmic adaptor subunit n=1 Tax=Cyanophyceae TaxID=3028117 RepID=UPI00232AABFF|nr:MULTISPECIES: efflux RND transporter periplasmic adaptor subunit [Cyanophyceae]MDB9341714.1 efflux RND transporter periplasmic adaptor subunit [Nodularia spumigena CS-589/07]MDB9399624.1 efflux RND transporter periplasmic adaptor subunit [Microcystis aeruginosa CS-567/02-A1]MDB9499816.1 efflux RND transporter periplasmic adaptor subunit [Nodularia spumigena CS-336/02]MDB9534076.1 efflux RND transporter periplasmic adaptor subunit [Nodularia spumigena CS-1038]